MKEANFCDNLVTILPGIWQILAYIDALACGCNSLIMLVDVVKCELALDGPTGLRPPSPMRRLTFHSCRSATMGSTLLAWRAGNMQASSAASKSTNETALKTIGSIAPTP